MKFSDLPMGYPQSTLFTVRVWRETLGSPQGETRMQVRHVLSGETRYFRDWKGLVGYLEQKLYEIDQVEWSKGENQSYESDASATTCP